MVSLLEEFANSERQLLIIAEDIKGDALDALLMNKERGSLKVRKLFTYVPPDRPHVLFPR